MTNFRNALQQRDGSFVVVTISRCCKRREKAFNWLVKRWHGTEMCMRMGEKNMLYKALFFITALPPLYGNSPLLWTRRKFTSCFKPLGAQWFLPPNFSPPVLVFSPRFLLLAWRWNSPGVIKSKTSLCSVISPDILMWSAISAGIAEQCSETAAWKPNDPSLLSFWALTSPH